MSAIAFLAGMGAGINHKERQDKEDARAAARDKREQDRFDADMADRAEAKSARELATADKAALREAGTPMPVTTEGGMPATMDARDIGQPGEAPVAPKVYKAGANSFASQGLAEADAQKQVRGRVAATMAAQGNVLGADQLRTSGIQGEAAQLALDDHKATEAKKSFDDGLNAAARKGVDAVMEYTNNSAASPEKARLDAKVGPDGKREVIIINPDGTERPSGMRYTPDAAGARNMALDLSKLTPTDAKMKHYMAEEELKRKIAHDDGMLKVAKQNADTQEQYRKDQAANMQAQRALQAAHDKMVAAGKAKVGEPLQVTLKDKRDFESDLSGHIKDQFPVKDGADEKERAAMSAQATAKRSLGNTLFENNARIGVPLTAGTVMQAMDMAADRKNIRVINDAQGNAYEGVVVNGQPIITGPPMQKKAQPAPGAAPQPGPAPMASPAAVARQGVAAPETQIPAPPPQVRQVGLNTQPNPAFAEWNKKFGDAWRAQQAAQSSEQDASAAAAKSSFNPYAQNRVN